MSSLLKIKYYLQQIKRLRFYLTSLFIIFTWIACTDIDFNPIDNLNAKPELQEFRFLLGDTIKYKDSTDYSFEFLAKDPDKNKLIIKAAVDSGSGVIQLLNNSPDKDGFIRGLYRPNRLGNHILYIESSDTYKKISQKYKIYFYDNKKPLAQFRFTQLTNTSPYKYQFDANESSDPDGEIIEYTWRFNGEYLTVKDLNKSVVSYSFTDAGSFPVTLFVKDNDLDLDSSKIVLQTNNKRPVIKIDIDKKSGASPLTVKASAANSFDSDGSIESNTWYTGDDTDPINGLNFTYTYKSDGVYPLRFKAIDNYGLVSDTTIIITVLNANPVPVLKLSKEETNINSLIEYDATESLDPDGSLTSYKVTVSPGNRVFLSPKGSIPFNAPGTYSVKLEVEDNKKLKAEIFKFIKVINNAPIVSFRYVLSSQNVPAKITLSPSIVDLDNDKISKILWDLTETTISFPNSDAVEYTFKDRGRKFIKLTATDQWGASSSFSAEINLGNGIPKAELTLSKSKIKNSEYLLLSGAGNDPDGGTLVNYEFSIANDTGFQVLSSSSADSYQYLVNNKVGTVNFYLRVEDDEGDYSNRHSKSIIVENSKPVALLDISNLSEYAPFSLIASGQKSNDPDPNDSLKHRFYLNDRLISSTATLSTILSEVGVYDLRYEVIDSSNEKNIVEKTLKVLSNKPVADFELSSDTVTVPAVVQLNATNSSDPDTGDEITNYSWSFTDGSSDVKGADKSLISHEVNKSGLINITLTVTDKHNQSDAITKSIFAKGGLAPVNFSVIPKNETRTNSLINFSADQEGLAKYSIYYSNASTSNQKVLIKEVLANHLFSWTNNLDPGPLSFFLQTTDKDGYQSPFTELTYRIINSKPEAKINIPQNTGVSPVTLSFDGSDSNDPDKNQSLTFTWVLNDNIISSAIKDTFYFNSVGNYKLTLIVRDDVGLESIAYKDIQIFSKKPIADFTFNPSFGNAPVEVTFTASNSSDPDNDQIIYYQWDMGDGTIIEGKTKYFFKHIYKQTGLYRVRLRVQDEYEVWSDWIEKPYNASNSSPVASLSIQPYAKQLVGKPIELSASASNDPNGTIVKYIYSYQKGLNDEIVLESSEQKKITVSDIYDIGTLNFKLRVIDNDDDTSSYDIKPYQITNSDPIAQFSVDKTSDKIPYKINVDASASYDPSPNQSIRFFWYLNDQFFSANISDSVEINSPNSHEIKLVVVDDYNASSSKTITVNGISNKPIANFTVNKNSGKVPESILFNASSSRDDDPGDYISNYHWNFGDGSEIVSGSDKAQVSHTYLIDGTFTVTLTVTDNFGKKDNFQSQITISGGLLPSQFSVSPSSTAKSGELLTFTADKLENYDHHWYYSLDGGTTKHLMQTVTNNNTLVYNKRLPVGTLNFYLQREDKNSGYISDFTQVTYIIANNNPTLSLSINPIKGDNPLTVNYNFSESSDPDPNDQLSYALYNNNTLLSKLINGSFVLNTSGIHSIKAVVTDNFGGKSESVYTISVNGKKPIASFTASPSTGFHPLTVALDASNSFSEEGLLSNYHWNFGNGEVEQGSNKSIISKTFNKTGSYNVTLTVTDKSGNTSFFARTITVTNKQPIASFTVSSTELVAGSSINLNASSSSDQNGLIAKYKWFINGSLKKETTLPITSLKLDYAVGKHELALVVADNEGLDSDQSKETITISNSAPIADFEIDKTLAVSSLTFNADASASYDHSPSQTLSYQWFLNNNLIGTNKLLSYSTNLVGSHELKLLVKDNLNASSDKKITITVQSTKPSADFTMSSSSSSVPATITFNANNSNDPDNGDEISNYEWSFGDGSEPISGSTQKVVQHTFAKQGYYIVNLTVTDKFGLKDSKQLGFQALNGIPIANFTVTPSNTAKAHSTLLFDASGSIDQGSAHLLISDAKEFGINSSKVKNKLNKLNPLNISNKYQEQLNKQLQKTINFKSLELNEAPGPGLNTNGSLIRYNWSYSIDGVNFVDIASVENNPIFIWKATLPVGPASFYLVVEDNQGASSPRQQMVYILTNNSPVAKISVTPNTGLNPLKGTLDASLSSDIDINSSLQYQWFLNSSQVATGKTANTTITGVGSHIVRLLVIDDNGASSEVSQTITVESRPPIAQLTSDKSFGTAPLTVQFNASGSYDDDSGDEIKRYNFSFGDGNTFTSSSPTATHIYTNQGNYTARVEVVDSYNKKNSSQVAISVGNSNPIARLAISPTTSAKNTNTVTLNASQSLDPSGDNIVRYKFSMRPLNGSKIILYEGSNNSHSFTLNANVGQAHFFLEVEDENGGISSEIDQTYIVQNTKPNSDFSLDVSSGVNGFAFNATNLSTDVDPNDSTLTYNWYLDNVLVSSSTNYSGNVNGLGNHVLRLVVRDAANETDIKETVLTVNSSAPTASFTLSPNTGQIPFTVSFDASASSDPDAEQLVYIWNFGDGSPLVSGADKSIVNHEYSSVGTFTVSLTVRDASNLSHNTTRTVSAQNGSPVAAFTMSKTTFKNQELITLDASSSSASGTATIVQYSWYYQYNTETPTKIADNNTSTYVLTPNFNVGSVKIGLIVTDNNANSSSIIYRTAIVQNTIPVASITADPVSGQGSYSISFNGNNSSDIDPNHASNLTYRWLFDGSQISTDASGTFTVNKIVGSYSLQLTVTDPESGSHATSQNIIVQSRPPVASFSSNPSSGSAPLNVSFDATASSDPDNGDGITNYRWNFGDGSSIQSSSSYVTRSHTFNTEGTYNVELRVTDQHGLTHTTTSTVTVGNGVPTASFTQSSSSRRNGQTVFLDGSASSDIGSGTISRYHWKLEYNSSVHDLTTTTTPTYTYTVNLPVGIQRIGLVVEDNDGANSPVFWRNITVQNTNPTASFTMTPSSGLNSVTVTVGITSTDPDPSTSFSHSWKLDNVTVSPNASNQIVVSGIGNHILELTSSDGDGASHKSSKTITVNNNSPTLSISSNQSSGTVPLAVNFTATANDPDGQALTYLWDFKDGDTSPSQNPSHTFNSPGTYLVSCAVSDGITTVTRTRTITVNNTAPSLSISANKVSGPSPLAVTFTATANDPDGQTLSYHWDFGDSTPTSSTQNPGHTFTLTGTFTVNCTVSDGFASVTRQITISTENDGNFELFTSSFPDPDANWKLINGHAPMMAYVITEGFSLFDTKMTGKLVVGYDGLTNHLNYGIGADGQELDTLGFAENKYLWQASSAAKSTTGKKYFKNDLYSIYYRFGASGSWNLMSELDEQWTTSGTVLGRQVAFYATISEPITNQIIQLRLIDSAGLEKIFEYQFSDRKSIGSFFIDVARGMRYIRTIK